MNFCCMNEECTKKVIELNYLDLRCEKCNKLLNPSQLIEYFKNDVNILTRLNAIIKFQSEKQKIPLILTTMMKISTYFVEVNILYKNLIISDSNNYSKYGIKKYRLHTKYNKDFILNTEFTYTKFKFPEILNALNMYVCKLSHKLSYPKYLICCKMISAILAKIKEEDDLVTEKYKSVIMPDSISESIYNYIDVDEDISYSSIKYTYSPKKLQKYIAYCGELNCKGLIDSTGKCCLCNSRRFRRCDSICKKPDHNNHKKYITDDCKWLSYKLPFAVYSHTYYKNSPKLSYIDSVKILQKNYI